MEINTILLGVLLVLAGVLCAVAIWALFEGVKAARSARRLTDDVDVRIVPLLEKADVTIDALNAELLRVDSIVSRVEEITDRVGSTTRTVQDVANAPGEIVSDIADRVRRAWKRRGAEASAANDARRAEAAAADDAAEPAEVTAPTDAPEPPVWPTAEQATRLATEADPTATDTPLD